MKQPRSPRGRIARKDEVYASVLDDAGAASDGGVALGRLAPDEIKRVIRSAFPRFRRCYEPVVAGDMVLYQCLGVFERAQFPAWK